MNLYARSARYVGPIYQFKHVIHAEQKANSAAVVCWR